MSPGQTRTSTNKPQTNVLPKNWHRTINKHQKNSPGPMGHELMGSGQIGLSKNQLLKTQILLTMFKIVLSQFVLE